MQHLSNAVSCRPTAAAMRGDRNRLPRKENRPDGMCGPPCLQRLSTLAYLKPRQSHNVTGASRDSGTKTPIPGGTPPQPDVQSPRQSHVRRSRSADPIRDQRQRLFAAEFPGRHRIRNKLGEPTHASTAGARTAKESRVDWVYEGVANTIVQWSAHRLQPKVALHEQRVTRKDAP